MKAFRFLAVVLSVCLLVGLLPTALIGGAAEPQVVLRFLAASDIHLTDNPNEPTVQRFLGMFESASAYAQTQAYTAIDAVVLVGDIVCYGDPTEYAVLKSLLDTADLPQETPVLTLMGNHEWWRYTNNGMTEMGANSYLNGIAAIDRITEKGLNWSTEIGGYRFIGLSPDSDESYSDESCDFAANEIAAAVTADDSKPVFVFQHHPIRNTVMGSFGSAAAPNSDALNDIYQNYPQILHFSGHSHISVNTPTAINQTTYTQYTTGTMATVGSDGLATYAGIVPHRDEVAQYTIVEVYKDNTVRMIPYDQYTNSRFASLNGDGSLIEYTVDVNHPESWLYKAETRADRTEAPTFASGDTVAVSGITHEAVTLSFPQATDNFGMYGYDVVCDDGTASRNDRLYSEWYCQPLTDRLTYEVTELQPETTYTVSVYPLDFFGNRGEPLTVSVTTAAAPEEEGEIILDPSAYTTNLVPHGDAESLQSTDWGIFKNTAFTQEQAHSGNYALKLQNNGALAQVQVNVRGVVPQSEYRIAVWVKVPSGAAKPTVQRSLVAAVESPWKTLDTVYGTVTATEGNWAQYTYSYTAPAKANIFQIAFYTADPNTYFYLDDLTVYRICHHEHTTHVEATADTVEHWSCRTCGKTFADADHTVEIDPTDKTTYVDIECTAENDVVKTVGYNKNDNRTYLLFHTDKTLPIADWGGYTETAAILIDGVSVNVKAAGNNNANEFQLYVPNDTADYTDADEIVIPAGTVFRKGDAAIRFPQDFILVKKNGQWIKKLPVVIPTDHGGDPLLPQGAANAGVQNGDFNKTTGQNFHGNTGIENGLGVMHIDGTDDYIQFNGVTVKAGVTYTLAFYVWVTEASGDFDFDLYFDGVGSPKGSWLDFALGSSYVTSSRSDGIKSPSAGWERVTVSWTAPADGGLYFGVKSYSGSGTVYIDDVSVTYSDNPCDTYINLLGATIRTDTDMQKQGIRYEVKIGDAAAMTAVQEVGVLLIPQGMLGGQELTVDMPTALKIAVARGDANWDAVLADGGFQATLQGSVINGRQNYAIVSRAYTVLENGEVLYGETSIKSVTSLAIAIATAEKAAGATTDAAIDALLAKDRLNDAEIAALLTFCRQNILYL